MTDRGFHYCSNTVTDTIRPFSDEERKYIVDLLKSFVVYYAVDVISFAVTTNGYHILLNNETAKLPESDVIMRHFMHCGSEQGMLMPGDPRIPPIAAEMCSLAAFITAFENQLSIWHDTIADTIGSAPLFNNTCHIQLLDPQQFNNMLNDIEQIPVKEGLVIDAEDYPFSSLGEWTITGERPFPENYQKHVTSKK